MVYAQNNYEKGIIQAFLDKYFLSSIIETMKIFKRILEIIYPLVFIYLFLFGIKLLEISLACYGESLSKLLVELCGNPFVGLFVGILFTAIIQSSSATTSMTVGLVASGLINIRGAIPIILGANIGTTITNTLISFTHITRKDEFKNAFVASIIHDVFNILNVILFFPVEMKFHILENISYNLTGFFIRSKGATFKSPLKIIVEPLCKSFHSIFNKFNFIPLILSLIIIFVSLYFLVKILRKEASGKMEILIDRFLFKNTFSSFMLGLSLTAFIQSSSITTSLIVPIAGAGILSIEKIFPYVLGANIGTTITALLASLVTGKAVAVQIALTHTLFNVFGTMIFLPFRFIPIFISKKLGLFLSQRRALAFLYISLIFFIIPLFLIIITWR